MYIYRERYREGGREGEREREVDRGIKRELLAEPRHQARPGCVSSAPSRGTSLIRNSAPLEPYSRFISRDIWWS